MAIVGFNLCYRMAVTPLDPDYVDDRAAWLKTASPIFEVLLGLVGGGLAGFFLSCAMPGCCPGCGSSAELRANGNLTKAYGIAGYLLLGGGIFAVAFFKKLYISS